ncbi:N-acetylmuramoyl-L-alanine amidase AmiA [Paramixta manurensis]|uniref:N-acetylmuramoyl-L-alanine amidase AmiA n=1 Tax=Paramixta manurensis TaxID=2740817 RepID=A0A6M8UEX3_9GAMM|nr:N-acetylmuramoyl-L-alanine amidase AmiA [Erwiniaceae bacterium PD-1]
MKTFLPLTSRRQLLLSGLALALLPKQRAQAKEEDATLKLTPRPHRQASRSVIPAATGKRIVMIDPGHGGIDSGAVGEEGSEEKHIVLEIANNIRRLLSEHPRIEVRLTRESDHFIPLYERVEIAHQHGANLFMSIHADGFTSPDASGASVFALSNRGASSAMARYMSEKENAADAIGGVKVQEKDNYLQQVLFDLVQTDTIKNSLTLGQHVLKQIRPVHHLHSQETEQAAFAVLKSPSIPSVLVETSFITNPGEERLLGSTAFRQKIASAIVDGIISYFDEYDSHNRRPA